MTDSNQKLEELFEKQYERDQEVIASVSESLQKVFIDEKQYEVVFDMYQQVYKLSGEVQELNHANIFLNSYIESFYGLLVGPDKLLNENDFKEYAAKAYKDSLQKILDVTNKLQEGVDE